MVRVISLEQALAQGNTEASIERLILWHEAAMAEMKRPKLKFTRMMSERERERNARRHEDTINALDDLASELRAYRLAKAA